MAELWQCSISPPRPPAPSVIGEIDVLGLDLLEVAQPVTGLHAADQISAEPALDLAPRHFGALHGEAGALSSLRHGGDLGQVGDAGNLWKLGFRGHSTHKGSAMSPGIPGDMGQHRRISGGTSPVGEPQGCTCRQRPSRPSPGRRFAPHSVQRCVEVWRAFEGACPATSPGPDRPILRHPLGGPSLHTPQTSGKRPHLHTIGDRRSGRLSFGSRRLPRKRTFCRSTRRSRQRAPARRIGLCSGRIRGQGAGQSDLAGDRRHPSADRRHPGVTK
jgi:hypothetical protein